MSGESMQKLANPGSPRRMGVKPACVLFCDISFL